MNKLLLTVSLFSLGLLAGPAGAADVAAGKALADDHCVDCHGEDGAGDDDFPAINGMAVDKFVKAMREYQDGTRSKSPQMTKAAKKLSAAQLADVAAYYATQK